MVLAVVAGGRSVVSVHSSVPSAFVETFQRHEDVRERSVDRGHGLFAAGLRRIVLLLSGGHEVVFELLVFAFVEVVLDVELDVFVCAVSVDSCSRGFAFPARMSARSSLRWPLSSSSADSSAATASTSSLCLSSSALSAADSSSVQACSGSTMSVELGHEILRSLVVLGLRGEQAVD
jgi:hypothetical protein